MTEKYKVPARSTLFIGGSHDKQVLQVQLTNDAKLPEIYQVQVKGYEMNYLVSEGALAEEQTVEMESYKKMLICGQNNRQWTVYIARGMSENEAFHRLLSHYREND